MDDYNNLDMKLKLKELQTNSAKFEAQKRVDQETLLKEKLKEFELKENSYREKLVKTEMELNRSKSQISELKNENDKSFNEI